MNLPPLAVRLRDFWDEVVVGGLVVGAIIGGMVIAIFGVAALIVFGLGLGDA